MNNIRFLKPANGQGNSHLQVIYLNMPGQNYPHSENRKEVITPNVETIFLQKFRDIVCDNIDEPEWCMEELSSALHLSYIQLYRKIKALTGEPPSNFIRRIRMEKAETLLKTTNLHIAEIAYDLGFNDPNYFSRVFSKVFGCSPRKMRKQGHSGFVKW